MKKRFLVARRRALVSKLLLQGMTQQEICLRLGLPPGAGPKMISVDVKAIRERWQQSAVRDFDGLRVEQLARLDQLLTELWDGWERSKREQVSYERWARERRQRQAEGDQAVAREAPPQEVTRKVERQARDGNPAFTAQILNVINAQSELMGLTDKRAQDAGGPPIVGFQIVQPDGEPPPPAEPAPCEGGVLTQAN
jgi:hypothetical protein